MYLKSLEMSGFKSFPVKTKLEFGKGMTAVVGPNGCGKSNISDAIRWALGEQSAKLLRGSKMEDCIFSGTDTRKALGMSEVSLTFADCENTIDTEFNEITVTRRVFRSGEGQYFINKTACRLKDIQRLFMDTGIGTNSYSLMEQGRVDLILSSRPEDRRAVFEEASGITKYKTDKRETLRKLEHTETNLLRLADIIKEVKRQIISLQRQAGKARRVQRLRQELRSLDIFVSRERIEAMSAELRELETRMASSRETIEALQQEIQGLEEASENLHKTLSDTELNISDSSRKDGELGSRLERTEQSIVTGQTRIEELRELLKRDSDDAARAAAEREKQEKLFGNTRDALKKANEELAESEKVHSAKTEQLAEHESAYEKMRASTENLYADSIDMENQALKLQNQLQDMEVQDRSTAGRRERTAAEQSNLSLVLEGYERRLTEFSGVLKQLEQETARAESGLSDAAREQASFSDSIALINSKKTECMSSISSLRAQLEIINGSIAGAGPSLLLDEANTLGIDRERLVGALFEQLDTAPEFRTPLEAVLRSVLDAMIVTSVRDGLELLRRLESDGSVPARIVALDAGDNISAANDAPDAGIPLLDKVSCPDRIRPLARRLLLNTMVVERLDDVPCPVPRQMTYVTRRGAVVRGAGMLELYRRDMENGNPLARKHQAQEIKETIDGLTTELDRHDSELAELSAKRDKSGEKVAACRAELAERQRAQARKEGEYQGLKLQADRARENLETVTLELQELEKQSSPVEARSAVIKEIDSVQSKAREVKDAIARQKLELSRMERDQKLLVSEATESRIRLEKHKQATAYLETQNGPMAERISELERMIEERSARAGAYQAEIENNIRLVSEARKQIPALKDEIEANEKHLSEAREQRAEAQEAWQESLDNLKSKRAALDELREKKNELNTRLVEQRMKRSAAIDRITADYRIPADGIAQEPAPEWSEGRPDMETLENTIAELRAKLEAMGPVYEGAIEEYRELEERYAFLQNQQNDLVKSKEQLMDMIKKINKTTTEMFAKTFSDINNNFQAIFKQLFGGGSAKLMLADEEDVLESGIEIIVKPPGKRLQSVSLLSGGERALTAVSLLFAIYMFKPSPFCVLDELDAPLDEANIGRFIKVLKGFLQQSQFVLITHNRQTISAADVLYGVTMEEFGVSKVMSMKFTDANERSGDQPEKSVRRAEVEAR